MSEQCFRDREATVHDTSSWSKLTRAYLELEKANSAQWATIKYADILKGDFRKLERVFGKDAGTITLPKRQMNLASGESHLSFDPTYYTDHRYLDYLTEDDLKSLVVHGLEQFIEKKPHGNLALEIKSTLNGYGDAITGSIIAHSLQLAAGRKVLFYTKRPEFAKLWLDHGARWWSKAPENAINVSGSMTDMYRAGNRGLTRLEFYRSLLPREFQRMKIVLPKLVKNFPELSSSPFEICIFPSSVFGNRTYHANHWRMVISNLRKILPKASLGIAWNSHTTLPAELAGCAPVQSCESMHHAAALIQKAKLVLGMDSGPMHVAGILGVNALAAIGPVSGKSVFGLFPSVSWLEGSLSCAPCGFQPSKGYRPKDCSKWCASLNSISPEVLAKRAKGAYFGSRS